jgi:GNAT superfamily N-acetyltransferase
MNAEIDPIMKETIERWGLPKCLEIYDKEVVFKFDEVKVSADEYPYHCKDDSAKFCLFVPASNCLLFTMEFYHRHQSFFNTREMIKLELIIVHDHTLRGQGIASYYLKRLIEYAKSKKMDGITVVACTKANLFKKESKINALSQKRLVKFYQDHSTQEMPIEVLST